MDASAMYDSPIFSTSSSTHVIDGLSEYSYSFGCEMGSHCGFYLHFPKEIILFAFSCFIGHLTNLEICL